MFLVAEKCNDTSAERGSFDLVSITNGAYLSHDCCSKQMLSISKALKANVIGALPRYLERNRLLIRCLSQPFSLCR